MVRFKRNDIVWLNQKLKYEIIGEIFEMDIEHWVEVLNTISDNWFGRLRALFFAGNIDQLAKDLEYIGISKLKKNNN